MYDDAPRGRRRAEPDYDDVPRQRGGGRYEDDRRSTHYEPRFGEPRFGEEAEEAPRARRDWGADFDGADSGRHSRTGFVDLADDDDDTPTLVDMASRRARREQQDPVRGQAGRGARRSGRVRADDDVADDQYWSRLRGEAN